MSETPEPDWHLLPHSPASFFGLPEPFEMRDLKRAYGRLIKKYRPDFHPDEFQKIRAAYEALKSNEAIDQAFLTPDINAELSSPIEELPGSLTGTVSYNEPRPPLLSLRERLDSQADLQQVYSDLRQQAVLSEHDYVGLAVLADAVETDEEESFLNWIISGLQTRPASAVLISLAQQYCQQSVPDEQIEFTINQLADRLPQLTFAQISLPLWLRLIRLDSQVASKLIGEPRFPRQWTRIGSDAEFAGSYAQFQLSLELLPAVAVTDDKSCFEELAQAIDMEHQYFSPQDDFRREFADTVRYFIVKSQVETAMQPKHQLLRELVIDYCTKFDKLAVLEKYRERYRLALPGLCELFSYEQTPDERLLVRVAQWVSADAKRYLETIPVASFEPLREILDAKEQKRFVKRFRWRFLYEISLAISSLGSVFLVTAVFNSFVTDLVREAGHESASLFLRSMLFMTGGLGLGAIIACVFYRNHSPKVREDILRERLRAGWRLQISSFLLTKSVGEDAVHVWLDENPDENLSDDLAINLARILRQDALVHILSTLFPHWTDPWNEHPFAEETSQA